MRNARQPDLFVKSDQRRDTLLALIDAILADRAWQDASASQIAAEMVRACVGTGPHALPVPVPSGALKRPKKSR